MTRDEILADEAEERALEFAHAQGRHEEPVAGCPDCDSPTSD